MIRLGLIGIHIAQSRSPDLHERLGRLIGRSVRYDLFDGAGQPDFDFGEQLAMLKNGGYRGTNVTFPFKQDALAFADRVGAGAARVGSTNTLVLEASGVRAENTDFTGFVSAWRFNFDQASPGHVIQIGAGGVGRAVAHGLAESGAASISIVDLDIERAAALAREVSEHGGHAKALRTDDIAGQLAISDGVANCSPIGHVDHPGCPIATEGLHSGLWLFDAVYTPAETELMAAGRAAGATLISGVDLFVFQGIDAFKFFANDASITERVVVETPALRAYYHQQLIGSSTGKAGSP